MTFKPSQLLSGIASIAVLSASPALAQTGAQQDDFEEFHEDEILVVADRLRGQLDVPQVPILELNEDDIAAYGVGSIAELVAELAPQTGSGRGRGSGRPVFLVNGMRVSSFREFRSYPPEAIRKVEVLPEEVALRYGYPADQRVMNFILKDNFSSTSLEQDIGQPSRGGFVSGELEATYLKISGASRFNLNVEAELTSSLTEAERGVIQTSGTAPTVASDPDPAAERTLVSASERYEATGTYTLGIGKSGGSLTLNASAQKTNSRQRDGYDLALLTGPGGDSALRVINPDDPILGERDVVTLSTGAALNHPIGDWQLSATLDGSITQTDNWSDRSVDASTLVTAALAGEFDIEGVLPVISSAGSGLAQSKASDFDSLVTLIGRPLLLPAGELTTTLRAGYSLTDFESSDTRNPGVETHLTRHGLSGGLTLGVPITSRREDAWAAVGDISLNFSAGIDELSDFGTLYDWTAGVVWAPTEKLNLQASYIYSEAAPGLSQLGSPSILRFNVPAYDFTRGETVLIETSSGGNPLLRRETRRDVKLSANWEMPILSNARLMVEYFDNNSQDVTASFPLLTPAIEAAFPGRVTRDASGKLLALDQRPITLTQQDSKRLRYGINLRGSFGKAKEIPQGVGRGRPGLRPGPGARGAGRGGPPPGVAERGGGRRRGPGGPRGPGGGGDGRGRFFFNLSHTIELKNEVLIASGLPVLDLLNGDALSGSGTVRHSAELSGGMFRGGFGMRLSGNYSGSSRINGTGLPGSSDLRFSPLAKLNLRVFANLGQQKKLVDKHKIFKGMRLTLRVDNLIGSYRNVTDSSGAVPLRYQPDLIDPRGRFIEIELRKMF